MDKSVRKESSIPVQGRISIVDLANMDRYWQIKEGISIKSMSQLLSWTFTAMCDVIKANGKMPEVIKSVSDAHRYLNMRGLYQQSMKKKGQSRIIAAMGFENLRSQGLDPAHHSQTAYNTVHSKCTSGVYDGEVDIGQQNAPSKEEILDMVNRSRKTKAKNIDYKEEELNNAKNSNIVINKSKEVTLKENMSDDELSEYNRKRDEERIKLENNPIKVEDFKLVNEKTV